MPWTRPQKLVDQAWPELPSLILNRQTGRVHYKEVEAVELWYEGAGEGLTVAARAMISEQAFKLWLRAVPTSAVEKRVLCARPPSGP